MVWAFVFFSVLLVSFIATRAVIALNISDNPDAARKLHKHVTPTSGGIAIILAVGIGIAVAVRLGVLEMNQPLVWALVVSLIGGILGLLDDIFVLAAKLKLAVMLGAVIVFVMVGARIEAIQLTATLAIPLGPAAGALGTILWLLVLVNTINFMDGSNGMALGCAAIGLLGLCGLVVLQQSTAAHFTDYAIVGWIGSAACFGFLFWNSALGKVFAGDSGALFVGLLSGTLGVLAVTAGVQPLSVAMCFLPMLVDVILTVMSRLRRRENVLTPHSHHAYQTAIRFGATHGQIARRYWLNTLFCCICAIGAQNKSGWNITAVAFLILTFALVLFHRKVFALARVKTVAENTH